ncbi:MAG TPA: cytochrome c-type biogenesis protein [Gemmatimonadaceae bacterium]|nr:cytochrome c-type biogenesis protein [Gemmatimonadaceae bacterium]
MSRRARVTAAFLAVLCLAGPALAQDAGAPARPAFSEEDPALEARTSALASTLRCPVCQGESIQDSPSELAQNMRAVVRDQLRAGKTPDEVKAYFVSKYGEWILLEPEMKGLNVLLYLFPVLLVIGGLTFVAFLVRRWTTPQPDIR